MWGPPFPFGLLRAHLIGFKGVGTLPTSPEQKEQVCPGFSSSLWPLVPCPKTIPSLSVASWLTARLSDLEGIA